MLLEYQDLNEMGKMLTPQWYGRITPALPAIDQTRPARDVTSGYRYAKTNDQNHHSQ
jgi:hypothetical protein